MVTRLYGYIKAGSRDPFDDPLSVGDNNLQDELVAEVGSVDLEAVTPRTLHRRSPGPRAQRAGIRDAAPVNEIRRVPPCSYRDRSGAVEALPPDEHRTTVTG